MKQVILATVVTMMVATTAFAQAPRRNDKMTTQSAPAESYSYTPSYYANNELTALLGFQAGAPNIGVDYARMNNGVGFGGYFFMQTSKEKGGATLVSQVMAFGGLFKLNLIDTVHAKAYVAPGFGLSIVKDGAISATGSKSDETVIGPMWKMGVSLKLANSFHLGLETTAFGNFFNDSLNNYAGPSQYYSVAGTFTF